MAVVTVYGDEFTKTRVPREFIEVAKQHGRVRAHHDKMVITAADSVGSKYYLGKLPSNCRLLPDSKVYFDAIGASATLDIGDADTVDALSTDLDISSAGSAGALDNIAIEEYGQYLWEMLGLSADPGGQIDIIGTLAGAAATNTGDLVVDLRYVVD